MRTPAPPESATPHVFALVSDVPFRGSTDPQVTAVNVVCYALLAALRRRGCDVSLQILLDRAEGTLRAAEEAERRHLEELGICVLPPLSRAVAAPPAQSPLRRLVRVLGPGSGAIERFYPALRLRAEVARRVRTRRADLALTLWSPEGVAASHGLDVFRVAYQGDVDFVPAEVRIRDPDLFVGGGTRRWTQGLRQARWLERFRRAHHRLMAGVGLIANVTATNADHYSALGHPASVYVGNTWTDAGAPHWREAGSPSRPARIVGHVGRLGQTGSSYGLRFLLRDVVPLLPAVLAGIPYEVHIIGGGEPVAGVRRLLDQPGVVRRGYVQDLDAELERADALLVLNNAGRYLAAYTRHVIAWSQGLALVVHAGSRKAVPEVVPGENVLMGETPQEVAEAIRVAVADPAANERVRRGGRRTYERSFTPDVVAGRVFEEVGRVGALAQVTR